MKQNAKKVLWKKTKLKLFNDINEYGNVLNKDEGRMMINQK